MQHVDELPSEYAIHNFRTKENHWLFLSRIVNKNQICFAIDHLEHYHNYPYIGGIDIFVLDNLYMDDHKERKRDDDIMRLLAVADGIRYFIILNNLFVSLQQSVRIKSLSPRRICEDITLQNLQSFVGMKQDSIGKKRLFIRKR